MRTRTGSASQRRMMTRDGSALSNSHSACSCWLAGARSARTDVGWGPDTEAGIRRRRARDFEFEV